MIPRYRAWGRNENYPGTPSEKFEMFYDVSVVTTYQDKVQHVIADFGMYNGSEYNGTEIIDYTLMQSTGLTDKDGKEIFEGDILSIETDEENVKVEVSWDSKHALFVFESKKYNEKEALGELFEDNSYPFKIIGNIHTNPELLEVEK